MKRSQKCQGETVHTKTLQWKRVWCDRKEDSVTGATERRAQGEDGKISRVLKATVKGLHL